MPRPRTKIKVAQAAEMIGCSPKTVKRLPFKFTPLNPNSKRPTYLVERKEVEAFLVERERQGRVLA